MQSPDETLAATPGPSATGETNYPPSTLPPPDADEIFLEADFSEEVDVQGPLEIAEEDAAIWHTMDILQRLNRGDVADREPVHTHIEPVYGPTEVILANGDFELWEEAQWGTPDGPAGQAATEWQAIDYGHLTVSTMGFYLHTTAGVSPWDYGAIVSAELVGPGRLCVTGTSQRGTVTWLLVSIWAELVFVLWARARYPQHPQLATHAWIPEGWVERVSEAGVSPSPASGSLPAVALSWYDILQVAPNASSALITAAFRVRAKAAHPDKGGSADEMAEVNEAYRVLNDPVLRAQYDAEWGFVS